MDLRSTEEGRWGGDTGPEVTDEVTDENTVRGMRGCPQDTAGSSDILGFSPPDPTALSGDRARYPSLGELEDAAFQ